MAETFHQWKNRKAVEYRRLQLMDKIRLATKLGFTSDATHWKSELKTFDELVEQEAK